MRWPAVITGLVIIGLLGLTGSRQQQTCAVLLKLTDSASGRELSGVVRVTDANGKPIEVAELMSRGLGLSRELGVEEISPIHSWRMLTGERTVRLPRTRVTIQAFSGLETEMASTTIDLSSQSTAKLTIALVRFANLGEQRYRSANTHVHVMKTSREDCDRYLKEVIQADALDALFLSYLERTGADQEYTSNRYTSADLAALSRDSGRLFGNGEEHRNNFEGYGEGYGHVMLLDIKQLIQPVSIGPGIMKAGSDGLPLQRGIDTARNDGATIVWCHNRMGLEDIPNLLTGRINAINIFDGSMRDSYKDSFYRYLDIGLQVPFSTGTDWFVYDFSRVYCRVEGDMTVANWLKSLSAGKSFITNGPLLELTINGKSPGETVGLKKPQSIRVKMKGRGRCNFERLELVRNGEVIYQAYPQPIGGHFEVEMATDIEIKEPSWLVLRTPPPPIKDDPTLAAPVSKNEFGRDLFAHTSAVYVTVGGQQRFDPNVARELLAEMQSSIERIEKQARFTDDAERQRVLDVYRDGIEALEKRISSNTPQQAN